MDYDDLAARVTASYELALFAMRGQYLALRAPGVEITPYALRELGDGLRKSAETFEATARDAIEGYFATATEATSEALAGDVELRKRLLAALIRRALAENIRQVMKMARTGRLDFTKLLKDAHGGMGALVQAHMARLEFLATDTAGRRWNAAKLMRAMVRDFAYQTYVDTTIERLALQGDLVRVAYADESRDFVLSISGNAPGYPSLADVRTTTFHPNATATLEHHAAFSS